MPIYNHDTVLIKDMIFDNQWVNIEATVVSIQEDVHESMSQVGTIADYSGVIRFVNWKKSGKPLVEKGKTYLFENVVVSQYKKMFSVSFNYTSNITEKLDEVGLNDI